MEKFPDHVEPFIGQEALHLNGRGTPLSGSWQSRREAGTASWSMPRGTRHGRQPSLSDAIRNIKGRRGSVNENIHEVAQALKAPVSPKLVVCSPSDAHMQVLALTVFRYCA